MRLHDARTRRLEDVAPAAHGLLRVSCGDRAVHGGAGNLGTFLLADLVRRAAETIHRWRVQLVAAPVEATFQRDLAMLNCRVADDAATATGPVDLVLEPVAASADLPAPTEVRARGLDPLAVRLALLESRYRTRVDLGWAAVEAADRTLTRWRDRVAEWAESPSRPMCAELVQQVYDAFDRDLDTPAALQVMRRIEKDDELPVGAKFEMFAHLDALLGLDLARDVGKPRSAPARPPLRH
jgi:hypothetical protein